MLILCKVNLLNYHVYVVYDLACSPLLVDATDSKRGYLCSIVGSASIESRGVTATSKVVDVLLLLGMKQ